MSTPPRSIRRDLSRRGFVVLAEQISAGLVSVLGSAIALRRLGPSEFGLFSVAFGMVQLSLVATTELDSALPRLLPEYALRGMRRLSAGVSVYTVVVRVMLAVLLGALWFGLAPAAAAVFHRTAGLTEPLRRLSLLPLGVTLVECAISYWFGQEQFGRRALITIASSAATVFAGLLLGISPTATQFAQWYAMWGVILGGLACGDLIRREWAYIPDFRDIEVRAELGRAWVYSWPLTLSQGLYLGYQNVGRVLFGLFFTPATTGLVSFAMSTVERLTGIAAALPAALLPLLASLRVRQKIRAMHWVMRQSTRGAAVVGLVMLLGLATLGRPITFVLAGSAFLPAAVYLGILSLQAVFRLPSQTLGAVLQAYDDTRSVLFVNFVKFLCELGLFVVLIATMGPIGACFAVVGSYAVALILSIYCLRLHVELKSLVSSATDTGAFAATAVLIWGATRGLESIIGAGIVADVIRLVIGAGLALAVVGGLGILRGRHLRQISRALFGGI